jgi:hypothetical protein
MRRSRSASVVPDLYPITLIDMIEEVRRELRYRAHFWTVACREGRMNRKLADRRIDVMTAVLLHLEGERDGRGTVDQQPAQ